MNDLVLAEPLRKNIEQEGVAAYPNECCGVLIGRDVSGSGGPTRIVEELRPVANEFESGERFHRFSITPQALMQAERWADSRGKLVLGFYHSHPDHPARPSEYDRQHAWPFYSYVIVSIDRGRPAEMTCWRLDESTEAFAPQPIRPAETKRESE